MRNIGSIISSHNRATLHPVTPLYGCNCRVKDICPLNGECLTPKLVYKADIESNSNNNKKILSRSVRNNFQRTLQEPLKRIEPLKISKQYRIIKILLEIEV